MKFTDDELEGSVISGPHAHGVPHPLGAVT